MVGKRSMGEVKFYADHLENQQGVTTKYEPISFSYTVEETRTYIPDFQITTKSGRVFYIEYKGVLDLETRKKMVRVRDQHPALDVRFVFQKAGNKIRKGSPTTYWMWCDQNGFMWADNEIPKEWLK
jgi:predicted nuclease of restriction endonuclease-like RecB superfamily